MQVYAYGYEILFSETINWFITVIIAIATKSILETAVYMLSFMQLRESIGGFHAKTHIGCITISTLVYLVCLFLTYYTPINLYWIILICGLVLHLSFVFAAAPVEHANKPFSDREAVRFRKRGCILSFIYSCISLMLMFFPWNICKTLSYVIMLGLLSASVSMMIEYLTQKKKHNQIKRKEEKK